MLSFPSLNCFSRFLKPHHLRTKGAVILKINPAEIASFEFITSVINNFLCENANDSYINKQQ